eukprot:6364487-Amphidinium_carterae.2
MAFTDNSPGVALFQGTVGTNNGQARVQRFPCADGKTCATTCLDAFPTKRASVSNPNGSAASAIVERTSRQMFSCVAACFATTRYVMITPWFRSASTCVFGCVTCVVAIQSSHQMLLVLSIDRAGQSKSVDHCWFRLQRKRRILRARLPPHAMMHGGFGYCTRAGRALGPAVGFRHWSFLSKRATVRHVARIGFPMLHILYKRFPDWKSGSLSDPLPTHS